MSGKRLLPETYIEVVDLQCQFQEKESEKLYLLLGMIEKVPVEYFDPNDIEKIMVLLYVFDKCGNAQISSLARNVYFPAASKH